MPHQCTKCEAVFPNGTEEVLSGCPECGWNRFMYIRADRSEDRGDVETAGEPEEARDEDSLKRREILERIEMAHESSGEVIPLDPDESVDDDIASVWMPEEGSYRINVSSLMEKEEIVMSVGESGRYLVHLPSAFK